MTDSVPTVAEFTVLLEEHVPNTDQLFESELEALQLRKAEKVGEKLMLETGSDTSNLNAKSLRKHNLLTALAIVFDKAYAAVPETPPPAFEDPEPEGSGCSARAAGATRASGEDSDVEEDLALEEQSFFGDSAEALTQNTVKLDNA